MLLPMMVPVLMKVILIMLPMIAKTNVVQTEKKAGVTITVWIAKKALKLKVVMLQNVNHVKIAKNAMPVNLKPQL